MPSSPKPLALSPLDRQPPARRASDNAPLTQRDVLALLEGGDGHHPRRPLIVTTAFIMKAKRHPSMSAIPLERIVTIDSLDSWDLRSVSAATAGTGSPDPTTPLEPEMGRNQPG